MGDLGVYRPLLGGAMIGLAAALMMLTSGRICGISGISKGLLGYHRGDFAWRFAFVAGLVIGGTVYGLADPSVFRISTDRPLGVIALGGLLVGFGTVTCNGCTSGHGICGVSRLSRRSIVATVTFVGCGMLTAAVYHFLAG